MSFEPYLALEASAGSGKTFALASRYIALLYQGVHPSAILAITFTNKAANEIYGRILENLLHLPTKPEVLATVSTMTGATCAEILDAQPQMLARFLHGTPRISTIDSFFSAILRKFSLYLGFMPTLEFVPTLDEAKLADAFTRACIPKSLLDALVWFCRVEAKKSHHFFAWLRQWMEHDPLQPAPVPIPSKPDKRAFLQAWEAFVAYHAPGLSKPLGLFERREMGAILSSTLFDKQSVEEFRDLKKVYASDSDRLFAAVKAAAKEYFEADEAYFVGQLGTLFETYVASRQAMIARANRLTFGDLKYFVTQLVTQTIDKEFLYFRLDAMIDHLLIDEFQDTSIAQYQVLKPLITEICAGVGVKSGKSFFYVGDTKQSIYRFRGGVKELFEYVKTAHHVTADSLDTNYRSRSAIVDFVNQQFGPLLPHYIAQKSPPHKTGGWVKVAQSSEDTLCDGVVTEVKALLDRGIPPEAITLITYTNNDILAYQEALETQLHLRHFKTETSGILTQTRSVAALIAYLYALRFGAPYHQVHFYGLLGQPWQGTAPLEATDLNHPANALYRAIHIYALGAQVADILSLLELALTAPHAEALLEQLATLETKAAPSGAQGLGLITIHKAKGLQFPHVIVADRLGSGHSSGERLIFDYDGVNLRRIFKRTSQREKVDDAYRDALQNQQILARQDRLHALYVALTRAEESLTLCCKPKDSLFEELGPTPLQMGSPPAPSPSFDSTVSPPAAADKTPTATLTYAPLSVGRQQQTRPKESVKGDPSAIAYGIALHYLLEVCATHDAKGVQEGVWLLQNRFGATLEPEILQQIRTQVEALFADATFRRLTQGTILKEQRIFYQQEIKKPDIITLQKEGAVVIDYKTSLIQNEEQRRQVQGYQTAIEAVLGVPCRGYVCYLGQQTIRFEEV